MRHLAKAFFFFFSLLTLLCITPAFAQDSLRRSPTRFVNEHETDRSQPYKYIDSSLNETEIFHPMYRKQVIFQDLGNIGSPGRNVVFSLNRDVGFNGAFNPYDNYYLDRSTTRYYNTTRPYTELFYAQGSEELLFLKAKHAQNILPRWSAGLDFQRITSQGFFLRQKTSHYNIQLNTRVQSKNKRYELLAYALWNRGSNEENGGIASDSAYEALSGVNKSVNINLVGSENRYRNRSLFVKQYYKFGSPLSLVSGEDTLYDYKSFAQIAYTVRTDETNYIFATINDTLSPLLPNQFFTQTSNLTYDSLYNGLVENKVSLQLFGGNKTDVTRFIGAGIMHQGAVAAQPSYIRNFQNVIIDGQLEWENNKSGSLSLWSDGAYTISGFNRNNYKLNALARYRTAWFDVMAGASVQQYTPDYNLLKFYSNHFVWNNSFDATRVIGQKAVLNTRAFRNNFFITVNHHLVTNYAYLNSDLRPEQNSGTASVLSVQVNKTFQLGKFFFKHNLFYQQSNASYIPVPEIGGMARYYFQTNFFASILQIGFDAFYNSSYYGMGWSPASRMFYVQQQTRIGNYPVIDPFLSMQIKRAVIFFKYEHANQNLVNEGFYNTPHYPISLSSFRFGIRWRMYD
ncbi:MAG: putative porin [Bacteroidota bacterium]